MITPKDYLMGREKDHPINLVQSQNMANLLSRINHLFATHKLVAVLSSGYRPEVINKKIGGVKHSLHTTCAAIDLFDHDGSLAKFFKLNVKILEEYQLWMENPGYTKGWIHLDLKERKNRIFIP